MNLMLEMLMASPGNSGSQNLGSIDMAYAYDKIPEVLRILCRRCRCKSAYIQEVSASGLVIETFAYNKVNENAKKIFSPEEMKSLLSLHLRNLSENSYYILEDVEKIKGTFPRIYTILKVYGVQNCIHAPIYIDGNLYGYLAVENFEQPNLFENLNFVMDAAKFFAKLLEQKKVLEKYRYLASHDPMTGAWNRYAYEEEIQNAQYFNSVGLVYYNLSFLSHEHEDDLVDIAELVRGFYSEIQLVFKNYKIFRISCEEFVVFCPNVEIANFKFLLFLADKSLKGVSKVVYGSAYSRNNMNFKQLLQEAKDDFFEGIQTKVPSKNLYNALCLNVEKSRIMERKFLETEDFGKSYFKKDLILSNSFKEFMEGNSFDIEFFFNSMALTDNYPYFGDLNTNLFYICDQMKELFGFDSNIVEDLITKWSERIPVSSDVELYTEDLNHVLIRKKEVHNVIYRVIDVHGNLIWVECSGVVKFNPVTQEPEFFSGFVTKLDYSFIIDSVSGLEREGKALIKIKDYKEKGKEPVFLGFKLNYFDDINSSNGREAGNDLIAEIVKRLKNYFDEKVDFYRLDGLRFLGIITPGEDKEEVVMMLHSIIKDTYKTYGFIINNPCYVGLIDKDIKSQTPQEIIANILNVIELAKAHPNEKYFSYTDLDILEKKEKSKMAMVLSNNVVNNFENFRVVIQPVISAEDLMPHSGELLLRWTYEGRDISPAVFVPMLEKSNLIVNVGKWVFEQAVKNVRRISEILPAFKVNFNVSYNQIKDENFVHEMEKFLDDTEVRAEQLVMELTETHYNEDPNKLLDFVRSCKSMGMHVALDDFGSGYSSMELLLKYPSDIVKLDKSLIKEIQTSDDNREFINSIVYACHKFKKRVCIEGVETQSELDFALAMGCDMIQGYYFYKPIEIEDFYKKLVIENGLVKFNK